LSTTTLGGEKKHGHRQGIALQIGDHQLAVALGHDGQITSNDSSNQNILQYYHVKAFVNKSYDQDAFEDNDDDFLRDLGLPHHPRIFRKPYDYAGLKTFPASGSGQNYPAYAASFIRNVDIPHCKHSGKMFLGQRRESFMIALGEIFDLVDLVPIQAGNQQATATATDDIVNKAVTTWALEVHRDCIRGHHPNSYIGSWASVNRVVHREQDGGSKHFVGPQTNRLGMPLDNELLIGLPSKDYWNRVSPSHDREFSRYIRFPTFPAILDLLFHSALATALTLNPPTFAPTNLPRKDLVAVFLTGIPGLNQHPKTDGYYDQLRLNLDIAVTPAASQNNLGVLGGDNAGFPNGRRPIDDVVDIALRVLMGVLCNPPLSPSFDCNATNAPAGKVPFSDLVQFDNTVFAGPFPYLLTPCPGNDVSGCIAIS